MQNVTDLITGSDTHLKTAGSKITRFDLLINKLNLMAENLNLNKKILTVVYDKTDGAAEFVEKVSGGLEDTKEIMTYYNENFVLSLTVNKSSNAIVVNMLRPLKKSADNDLEDKKNKDDNGIHCYEKQDCERRGD